MSASACSSSLWPTMRTGDGAVNNLRDNVTEHKGRLEDAVSMWGTPTARDWKDGDTSQMNVPENGLLGRMAANWPTPRAKEDGEYQYSKGDKTKPVPTLSGAAQNWTTPAASDGQRGGKITEAMSGTSLTQQVATIWSTPRASDREKGGPNQAFGAGGVPLPAQVSQWSTPSVADTTGSRKTRSGARSDEPLLNGQAEIASLRSILPDHPISTVGEESSHIRRTLNPLFVEWLMGWPPGWTSLALTPPASNGCACSATALCRFKLHMRSALSQLGLPGDAPVQHDLFA